MNLNIRKYKNKDVDTIKAIWNSIVDEGESFMYDEHFSHEEIATMLKNQDAVYCSVNEYDEVLGFYILHPNSAGRGKHIANASYAVNNKYRGLGIGNMLGNHSIEVAKEIGFKAIQFNAVVSSNTGAIHLWESLGFKRVGEIPEAFRKDNDTYVSIYLYYRTL